MTRHGGALRDPGVTAVFVLSLDQFCGPPLHSIQPLQDVKVRWTTLSSDILQVEPYLVFTEHQVTFDVMVSCHPLQGRDMKRSLVNDVLYVLDKAHFSVHLNSENLEMILEWHGCVTEEQASFCYLYWDRGPRNDHCLGFSLAKVHLPVLSLLLDQVQLLAEVLKYFPAALVLVCAGVHV